MIQVEELTKDYGPRRAIDHISFHAKKGEILGFLGPNGAGKTTTMRILTGYMPPTSGTVKIGGYDILEESLQVRRIVGYMPESIPLYPDMTIFEYLKFMADLRHLKNVEDVIDDALERVDLVDRSESYISSLSKGMRQRVGLAQAILHQPEVLILDEPTIGLDPAQIREVRNLIREIGKEHTILLSTHILSEAQQICDRVLIINKGRIVAEDSPEQLQARLTGAQRIHLKVRGEADGLDKILGRIPGISGVRQLQASVLEFEIAPGREARPEVAKAVVENGYDLLELRPIGVSLEDIFLQLTRDEPEPLDEFDEKDETMEEEEATDA